MHDEGNSLTYSCCFILCVFRMLPGPLKDAVEVWSWKKCYSMQEVNSALSKVQLVGYSQKVVRPCVSHQFPFTTAVYHHHPVPCMLSTSSKRLVHWHLLTLWMGNMVKPIKPLYFSENTVNVMTFRFLNRLWKTRHQPKRSIPKPTQSVITDFSA